MSLKEKSLLQTIRQTPTDGELPISIQDSLSEEISSLIKAPLSLPEFPCTWRNAVPPVSPWHASVCAQQEEKSYQLWMDSFPNIMRTERWKIGGTTRAKSFTHLDVELGLYQYRIFGLASTRNKPTKILREAPPVVHEVLHLPLLFAVCLINVFANLTKQIIWCCQRTW